jgi:hypothetical protein
VRVEVVGRVVVTVKARAQAHKSGKPSKPSLSLLGMDCAAARSPLPDPPGGYP